jgi:16S rRNA (guanine527-N7)-methyltransferase
MSGPREPLELPSPPPLPVPPDLDPALRELGVSLDPAQLALLGDYLARLLAMNERVNLTAVTDPVEAWTKHVLDGLSIAPELASLPAGASVLDVGSGGGVPGIPLAIARPDLEVTLLEATQKKAAFLADVAEALGLSNVSVIAERAEDARETELAGAFDAVTARAVAKLSALLAWTAPFARDGGQLVLIKGQRAELELRDAKRAMKLAGCTHERTTPTRTGRVVVLRVRRDER